MNQIASEHAVEDASIESADIDSVIRKLYRKLDEEDRANEL